MVGFFAWFSFVFISEFIAEAFAEYINSSNPRKLSKKFGEQVVCVVVTHQNKNIFKSPKNTYLGIFVLFEFISSPDAEVILGKTESAK